MKTLVVFPKGSLTSKDKERLTKSGFCAVECERPDDVVMHFPGGNTLNSDAIMQSAMFALKTCDSAWTKARFTEEMCRRVVEQAKGKDAS